MTERTDGGAVVVGFTTAEPGRLALEEGIKEARLRGASLVVIHSMVDGPSDQRELAELTEHRDALEDIERRLNGEGIPHKTALHVRGMSPAEDLAESVRTEGASLLVIGYRRHSKSRKYFLGSDAQEIILAAPCPVLAVGLEIT